MLFYSSSLVPCSSAACFLSCDERWPELCIALVALCSETQCHAPLSQSCLGLQVTSCLPVFLSSGTAGAINQLPLSPVVSVCPVRPPRQQQHQTVSSGPSLLRGTLLHFYQHKCSYEFILCLFAGFLDGLSKSQLTFSYLNLYKNHVCLLMALAFHSAAQVFTFGSSFMMPLMAIN